MSDRTRDRAERVIRAWHAHETARGGHVVVDYDCVPPAPDDPPVTPAPTDDELTLLRERVDVHGTLA